MSELVKFQDLWDNAPANNGVDEPCLNAAGEGAYGNQCAIRMGATLKAAGVKVPKKKTLVHCWEPGHGKEQHVLRAEQLAGWLLTQRAKFGKAEKKKGKNWDDTNGVTVDHYKTRQGIVFFKDFWKRVVRVKPDGTEVYEKHPTGDHIDVWDGSNQSHGSEDYFERSKQIWFWELP